MPVVIGLFELGILAGILLVGYVAFTQFLRPWHRKQKAIPHWRDPAVMMRDESERQLQLAQAKYYQAVIAEQIRLKNGQTNQILFHVGSGGVEDEITRENLRKAAELDEMANRLRTDCLAFGPVPDLFPPDSSTDSEVGERGKDKRERTR